MAKNKKAGSIPKDLTLFARKEVTVQFNWEDVEGGEIKHKVRPVYISDSANAKTKETGLAWASMGYGYFNYETRKWDTNKEPATIVETPNVPFSNLQIVTLEIRDKGGRAYKCKADIGDVKGAYFDMREDVLLDCMFQQGIQVGGIVEGPFIFARVNSQMKPIRIGSLLHELMIEATEHNEKATIEDYEIGGVYTNKKGEEAVYLGIGYSRTCKNWQSHYKNSSYQQYGRGEVESKYRVDLPRSEGYYYTTDGLTKSEKYHIFLEKGFTNNKKPTWACKSRYSETYSYSYVKLVKSPTYKTKTGQIEIDPWIMEWVFDRSKTTHVALHDNLSKEQGYTNPLYASILEA